MNELESGIYIIKIAKFDLLSVCHERKARYTSHNHAMRDSASHKAQYTITQSVVASHRHNCGSCDYQNLFWINSEFSFRFT